MAYYTKVRNNILNIWKTDGKNNIKNLEYNYTKDMSLSCINIGSVKSVHHLSYVIASYCRAEI